MTTANKENKGFQTEANHYSVLSQKYAYASSPKNSCTGSDFVVIAANCAWASFESKTSNTDIFEFGSLSVFANGMIFNASTHLSNTHLQCLQQQLSLNQPQLDAFTDHMGISSFPESVHVSDYNRAKDAGKLIHLRFPAPASTIDTALKKSNNAFVKAHYLLISDNVYRIAGLADPLGLAERGAGIVTDNDIDYMTIRTARNGSKNGKSTVTIRVQFRLKRILPNTNLRISEL
jgi:hypothetical protein